MVFEVGGVVDLGQKEIKVDEPYLTVAGQTAPSPGITFIRGGFEVDTHDVVIQNIRVRVGDCGAPKKSGWEQDGLSTGGGAHDVIFDHNTVTWATDENMSMSGKRFEGEDPAVWRANTLAPHHLFQQHHRAEGLAWATHSKIEHSKGSLIHDNATDLLIVGNLYAHNYERNVLFKGGTRGVMINNLIYDPGQRADPLQPDGRGMGGSHAWQVGEITAIGNCHARRPVDRAAHRVHGARRLWRCRVLRQGQSGGGPDRQHRCRCSAATRPRRRKIIMETKPPLMAPLVAPMGSAAVQQYVLHNAGARTWDRDYDDVRLIADVAEGRGKIINSQDDIHGYPAPVEAQRPFNPATGT